MATHKRSMLAAGAFLTAVVLSGCGGAGYGPATLQNAAQPAAANAQESPEPAAGNAQEAAAPAAEGEAQANEQANEQAAAAEAPSLTPEQVTDQLLAKKIKRMGRVVIDEKGWVLYRFDKDVGGATPKSNCDGKCAAIWPPVLTDGRGPALNGILDEKVGTVVRSDGTQQLTLGGWPLYRYIGDKKPGQWKGQGVGGTWFVVAPSGKKNLTCVPKNPPPPPEPPATAQKSATTAEQQQDDTVAEDPGGESTVPQGGGDTTQSGDTGGYGY